MKFISKEHEKAFLDLINECNIGSDPERLALIYCLTISEDCRNHFTDLYDKEERLIKIDALKHEWVTSSSSRCIRLAYNLFNGGTPTALNLVGDEQEEEITKYLPVNIFTDGEYREYFIEALKIRFEDN